MINNDLSHYQKAILREVILRDDLKLKGDTIYRRAWLCWVKNKRIRGWLPILTKDGEDWVGYNYSAKDMATYILRNPSQLSWRYLKLKWVELGRTIGCQGTSRFWRWTRNFSPFITKMINPTLDMVLPEDTVFDEE
tara:strand:+ start:1102 stop:1509 length:408 start_codon:yes stop_codon:yes gene_type:complete